MRCSNPNLSCFNTIIIQCLTNNLHSSVWRRDWRSFLLCKHKHKKWSFRADDTGDDDINQGDDSSFGCRKCDKGCTNLDWEREADREQHCSRWTFSVMPSKKHYWPLCCVSSCSKDNTTQQTDESKDPKSVMNETQYSLCNIHVSCIFFLTAIFNPATRFRTANHLKEDISSILEYIHILSIFQFF